MAAGDRKYGRNKKDAQLYQMQKRLDINKAKRIKRHKAAHPKDKTVPNTVPDYRPRRRDGQAA